MFFYFYNIFNLISLLLLLFSLFMGLMSFIFMYFELSILIEWNLFHFQSVGFNFMMMFDYYSLLFSSFVMYISSAVFKFSKSYMSKEEYNMRFLFLLLLFILSMIMLIFSGNLITILIGWDGLGLVSFLLVIFYMNKSSLGGGLLTFLSNRVGDASLILSVSLMVGCGHLSIFFFNMMGEDMWVIFLLMLSAITKGAQLPFSAWLPAAMAAPTPVSSLVHSSTLVTAGVYLMIRFNDLLIWSGLNYYLFYISMLTMFMSGISANFEFDLKKIIAFSTLSQLSVMFMSLSLGLWKLAFFHMMTHALFKALMFLCVGSVMHGFNSNQDMRMKGGSLIFSSFISVMMNSSVLSLSGMPFLSGYYSKDLILEKVFMGEFNFLMVVLLVISTGMTVSYSFRMCIFVFMNYINYNSSLSEFDGKEEIVSLIMLMFGGVFGGFFVGWLIFPIPEFIFLDFEFKFIIFMIFMMGLFFSVLINNCLFFMKQHMYMWISMNWFMGQMWFISFLSTQYTMKYPMLLSKLFFKIFDEGWSEFCGGQGMYMNMMTFSEKSSGFNFYNMMYYYILFYLWMMVVFFFVFL